MKRWHVKEFSGSPSQNMWRAIPFYPGSVADLYNLKFREWRSDNSLKPKPLRGSAQFRRWASEFSGASMSSIFEKLNLKRQREILVVNAPTSFEQELLALESVTVMRDPRTANAIHFALVFATRQAEVDALSQVLAGKAEGDAVLWFAYPKATSKRYKCEFNRDTGWNAMRGAGFDTVRQVAIDEDWSALRFRRVEYIKQSKGGSGE